MAELLEALFPPRPTVEQFFRKATDCNQMELPDYWRWERCRAEAMWDIDHDGDPEVMFDTGMRACPTPALAVPRAHLTLGSYLRGSVSGFFHHKLRSGYINLRRAPYLFYYKGPQELRFIIRDETAGKDYLVGSTSRPGGFRFSWSWSIFRDHEYSMRLVMATVLRVYYIRIYYYALRGTDRFRVWLEQTRVDTDAQLIWKK